MIKIKLFDSVGTELNLGDFVKIQEHRNKSLTFYTKLEIYKRHLFPLQFFSYDRIIKIDELPEGVNPISDSPIPCWMGFESLQEIEPERLDIWRLKALTFNENPFIEVIQ